jgi:hypothetical protein
MQSNGWDKLRNVDTVKPQSLKTDGRHVHDVECCLHSEVVTLVAGNCFLHSAFV